MPAHAPGAVLPALLPAACRALALAAPALLVAAPAAADWQARNERGVTDAQVTSGGAVLGVVCNNGALDLRDGVYVAADGIGQSGGHRFVVDGETSFAPELYLGTFEPGDEAGRETLAAMIDAFRRGRAVAVSFPDGAAATFSLTGSSRALAPCRP